MNMLYNNCNVEQIVTVDESGCVITVEFPTY